MKAGFITALGTPLDKEGNLIEESLKKQVNDQIDAGALALLSMGSMGIQAFIRNDVAYSVAKTTIEAAAGRVPVFVGAMDCSIARAKQRIEKLEDLDIAGLVFTTPYYHPVSKDQMLNYFKSVAALTKHKVLLYDLPGVTQSKITLDVVIELIKTTPNIAGIKTNDTAMCRMMKLSPDVPEDFMIIYSGLDTFDVAYKWGIDKCLDGMPACTPYNTGKMFAAMEDNDYDTAAKCLNNIISLRDCFVKNDLWPSFTVAMNALGYEGEFGPDYVSDIKKESAEEVKKLMVSIGELK